MTSPTDLQSALAEANNRVEMWRSTADEARHSLATAQAEIERLRAEINRRKGDPVTRLHNLCEGLETDIKGSPYSREEWEQIDADNLALRKRAEAAEAKPAEQEWLPIETAPKNGTPVWVYVAARDRLPAFQCVCAFHLDVGWCADGLRPVTHWRPLPAPPDAQPKTEQEVI